AQPQRTLLQFQRHRRALAPIVHRRSWRLATRHAHGRSRPELPRPARRLEIYFPPGRNHARRIAGGHERLQVATASLDQRLDSDLQEIVADGLAQSTAAYHQDRGNRAPHLELRLSSPRLFVRASPSLDRRTAGHLAAHPSSPRADFHDRVRLSRGLLYLRAARTSSAHLDEGNPSAA